MLMYSRWKVLQPIGIPSMRRPRLASPVVKVEIASARERCVMAGRRGSMDMPTVLVKIFVLSLPITMPTGFPILAMRLRNQFTSLGSRRTFVSSMKARGLISGAPDPRQRALPVRLVSCSCFSWCRTPCRTRAAKIELRGHPWEKPSTMRRQWADPSGNVVQTFVACL
eukprot:scaffold150182_cov44-Attheya_sp.AAC.1